MPKHHNKHTIHLIQPLLHCPLVKVTINSLQSRHLINILIMGLYQM